MPSKKASWYGRVYLGRDATGRQQFYWCGRFDTKRERDDAVARARTERPWEAKPMSQMTGDELADRYLAEYELNNKISSAGTARMALKPFRAAFGDRLVTSVTRIEARIWAQGIPRSYVPQIVAMFRYAESELEIIERNPFRGLGGARGRGRADRPPPTVKEMERLLDACDALGDYAQQMRDFLEFGAYTLMRPSEIYELRWPDIDFRSHQIHKDRRLYRGRVDVPKTGRKTIPLAPPAEAILMRRPTRAGELVFVSKTGRRLTASITCQYWAVVTARAVLDFDVYEVTKHRGVFTLYAAGVTKRTIAQMAGWSEKAVDDLLKVYGHGDIAAQAEINELYGRDANNDANSANHPWE